MKSKFIVINKNGEIYDPKDFIENAECSKDFKILIEREALGIGVISENIDEHKPEYLNYAKKLGFSWEKNADIGFMSMDYKANLIHKLVKEYARKKVLDIGLNIFENSGSRMFSLSHPVVKAYANLYGERLFQPSLGDKNLVMGYDGSYAQFNLAGKYQISHKQIPFAHFSIAECFRLEQSGECMLFYRGRQFNMPDLHPYFKNEKEAWEWYPKIEAQVKQSAFDVNRNFVMSAAVSSEKYWKEYQKDIKEIAIRNQYNILVEIMPDAKKYWIVNVDYKIIDALGQSREISCIQIDVENAKRLGISYVDENNRKQNPIIIHSAVSGGIERYLYMVFDDFENSFPIWLHPIQLRLIPVSDKFISKCEELVKRYPNIRIDVDDRAESVSKKIKLCKNDLIPNYIVIGEKEADEKSIPELEKIIANIENDSQDKPFIPIQWPILVSQQVR